jgi:hypothetical protein
MRARYPLAFLAAALGVFACFPHPAGDFEDFGDRVNALAPPVSDGGGNFEAAPPPTEAVTGEYYVACLSQLAYGQGSKVFSFFAETKFEPEPGGGGKLSLALHPLKLGADANPPKVLSKADIVGETKNVPATTPNVAADGRYTIELGTTTVPGEANPITQRNVIIESTKLTGFFGTSRFCAQLNGNVTQPIPLTLNPPENICQFSPMKEGDAIPVIPNGDENYKAGACPF